MGEGDFTKREVLAVLGHVYDPDYRDRSIVDLGLVDEESVTVEDGRIKVRYRLTAPMCPFSAAIGLLIRHALEARLGLPVEVGIAADHFQAEAVTTVLQNEERSRELFERMRAFGLLEQCVRW